jgi:hypothetical protein
MVHEHEALLLLLVIVVQLTRESDHCVVLLLVTPKHNLILVLPICLALQHLVEDSNKRRLRCGVLDRPTKVEAAEKSPVCHGVLKPGVVESREITSQKLLLLLLLRLRLLLLTMTTKSWMSSSIPVHHYNCPKVRRMLVFPRVL